MRAPVGGRGRGFSSRGGGRNPGRSTGGGRGRGGFSDAPPDTIEEIGELLHECEGELVLNLTGAKIPYFNAPIFLENKASIGRVEEIFGSINSVKFTVKLSESILASSYKTGDKFYISPDKLLPLERFTQPVSSQRINANRGTGRGTGRGAGRGTGRGGRGRAGGRGSDGGRGRGRGGRFSSHGR